MKRKIENVIIRARFNRNYVFVPDLAVALTYRCNLNCDYCYVKGLHREFPKEMGLRIFCEILDWLESQGRKRIMLFGGEPTEHTKFHEALKLCINREFDIALITNGLFESSIAKALSGKHVKFVQFNYNPPGYYSSDKLRKLRRNIRLIHDLGTKVFFRYNISDANQDHRSIFEIAKEFDTEIMFGITFKGYSDNISLSYRNKQEIHDIVMNFIRNAKNKMLSVRFAGPIPRCMFNDNEWKIIKYFANGYSVCYPEKIGSYKSGARIVNPDLSVYACFHIFNKAPNLFDFKNMKELHNYFKKEILSLKWEKMLYEECENCQYRINKTCQGACLGAK